MNCNRTLFCIMVCSYAAMEHRKVKKKKLKQGENIELCVSSGWVNQLQVSVVSELFVGNACKYFRNQDLALWCRKSFFLRCIASSWQVSIELRTVSVVLKIWQSSVVVVVMSYLLRVQHCLFSNRFERLESAKRSRREMYILHEGGASLFGNFTGNL